MKDNKQEEKQILKEGFRLGRLLDISYFSRKPNKQIKKEAYLVADRNRWFIGFLILGLITLFSMYRAHVATERLATSARITWVKLFPDGSWDVDFYREDGETKEPDFFVATSDSIIDEFIRRRYQKIPASISTDYGFCERLMRPELADQFITRDGFNAPEKAMDVINCVTCPEVHVQVGIIDHYDSDKTTFNNRHEGVLYRSNVFITTTKVNKDGGGVVGKPDKKIVPIQWRIKTKQEIKEMGDFLRLNPIGVEIIDYHLVDDPSDN